VAGEDGVGQEPGRRRVLGCVLRGEREEARRGKVELALRGWMGRKEEMDYALYGLLRASYT
jgi:hypothetical protein